MRVVNRLIQEGNKISCVIWYHHLLQQESMSAHPLHELTQALSQKTAKKICPRCCYGSVSLILTGWLLVSSLHLLMGSSSLFVLFPVLRFRNLLPFLVFPSPMHT